MKRNIVILSAVLFAACSKSNNNPMSSSTVSFKNNVQPIFTNNCALSGCHAGSIPQEGQNLSAGQAFNNIVNVQSIEVPSFFRVKPSYSDSSYLYMKISGDPRIAAGTVRMPKGGTLQPNDIQTIKDWIDQGAQDN